MEPRVGNKFRLGRKIGSGSFGEIYLGTNIQTNEEVAIKLLVSRTSGGLVLKENTISIGWFISVYDMIFIAFSERSHPAEGADKNDRNPRTRRFRGRRGGTGSLLRHRPRSGKGLPHPRPNRLPQSLGPQEFGQGWVGVGDAFCFSGNEPFWFFLEEGTQAAQVCTAGGVVDMGRESDVDEGLEVDVSAIDPVKEFGFLVVGHEFDSYPRHMLREVNDWDWFLEEPSKEWDDGRDESDEARARSRRKRKRMKKAKGDAMEEDEEWMGESEEDEEVLRKVSKAKKGVYLTRSRDPLKPTKKARDGGESSSMQKGRADHLEVEDDEDDEDDDETLGGFIVYDDDAEPEAENDDHEDEEEFIDEEEDE
ncbi:hypothetical protein MLD38_029477 [Melastoma candidum]|uniref:Uncharacterized protein n=1 Tax=Melastoma candidum TaxID=119954 RepID=A0ACB9N5Z9_9MYRT|nr:hypothetical protein MLD38_029477 [Melastoma candidum]